MNERKKNKEKKEGTKRKQNKKRDTIVTIDKNNFRNNTYDVKVSHLTHVNSLICPGRLACVYPLTDLNVKN